MNDGTSFERQKGLHFSLGKKHNVFKKPGMKNARYPLPTIQLYDKQMAFEFFTIVILI